MDFSRAGRAELDHRGTPEMIITKSATRFSRMARTTARAAGRPISFGLAMTVVLAWIASGPLFGFSDTWQLIINTGTTIVTFLMVFLIQNAQNRDAEAVQIKLDELLRATRGAHVALLDLEELEGEEIAELRLRYLKLAAKAREAMRTGGKDTGTPGLD
jgi:low affinity Fe/Cu permease